MERIPSRSGGLAVSSLGYPDVSALAGAPEFRRETAATGRTDPGGSIALPSSQHVPGTLIISLDFELHWGVRDVKTVDQYRENLLGVRLAVPAILATFAEYEIHATWATVGFLFFNRRCDLVRALPLEQPRYEDPRLSPYAEIEGIGEDEDRDPFHFGRKLLEQVRSNPHQEIGTHTFSHYYCLEPRQNVAAFRADLTAAVKAAVGFGVVLSSIVFPRNQYDEDHLRVCGEFGLKAFRGNPQSWCYRPRIESDDTYAARAVRLLDSYWNLSSHNCYTLPDASGNLPINLPASRFLRPYIARMPGAQILQERRIKSDLTYAAQHGLVYHLWWHPHNFGTNLGKNIAILHHIFEHFSILRERYGIESRAMAEITMKHFGAEGHVVSEESRFARARR
jgi:peptidoglycan/xylan/chitin deacetylase (PgdA/CDA1 family)